MKDPYEDVPSTFVESPPKIPFQDLKKISVRSKLLRATLDLQVLIVKDILGPKPKGIVLRPRPRKEEK